jgi:hypothetical protein
MDDPFNDLAIFVLSMFNLFPGLILVLCIFCHEFNGAVKKLIASPRDLIQDFEDRSNVRHGTLIGHRLATRDIGTQTGSEAQDIPSTRTTSPRHEIVTDRSSVSLGEMQRQCTTKLRMAIAFQVLQVYLLYRMANFAISYWNKLRRSGAVSISYFTLGYSSLISLISLFAVWECWRSILKQTGERSILPLAFFLMILGGITLPWYELAAASQ